MFKKHNLRHKLTEKQKIQDFGAEMALYQVYMLLHDEKKRDNDALGRLREGSLDPVPVNLRSLQQSRIFSENSIRSIAIEYRLRFLDLRLYKAEIPDHALIALRRLEKSCGVEFNGAKILAPSEHFRLEHCEDDPLLFVRLGNKTWYLVDQWGNDVSPIRKWRFFPFRNKATFALTVFTLAFFVSSLFPLDQLIGEFSTVDLVNRLALFTWIFICNSAFIACIGLALIHELSVDQWKSPYIKRSF